MSYKRYLLTVLMAALASSFVERSVFGLLLQDIKLDLALSDTQLGFLSGIAFASFYALMGIPIARWADRGNRVTIISLTSAVGSVMVILCGMAGSFVQLLLIRIGVAVGEAGCVPTSHSLIADHFTRSERPRAVAIFMLGSSLAILIGFFLGGWLNEFYGWRVTFMLIGVPGLALAVLTRFTLREPRRGSERVMQSAQPSLRDVCVVLWGNATFRHTLLCFSVLYFFSNGIWKWQPAFFIRSYGLQTGELGMWFALIYGLGGLLGTYLGGELASRYAARNESLQLKILAGVFCCYGVFSACVYIAPNQYWAFALIAISMLGNAAATAPMFAIIQTLVPPAMRASSVAIVFLFANLIGAGLGPLAAGVLSDAFRPWAGEESLRYALFALCPGYLWGAWHLWRGSRTVARDLETEATRASAAV